MKTFDNCRKWNGKKKSFKRLATVKEKTENEENKKTKQTNKRLTVYRGPGTGVHRGEKKIKSIRIDSWVSIELRIKRNRPSICRSDT